MRGTSDATLNWARHHAHLQSLQRDSTHSHLQCLTSAKSNRNAVTQPLWEEPRAWLQLERTRVHDGSATTQALNYGLNAWEALTRNLLDGDRSCPQQGCGSHDFGHFRFAAVLGVSALSHVRHSPS